MDAALFRSELEGDRETELARLGSDRRLVALTTADLSDDTVLKAAYRSEAQAAVTFGSWADNEGHSAAATVFEDIAAIEQEHKHRLAKELGSSPELNGDGNALHTYLRDLQSTHARVGAGLIARPLIGAQTLLQFVSYFINAADDQRADLFRELRADTEAQLDQGTSLLDEVCETESDWAVAQDAALEAIDVVYEEYAGTLSELGLNPKPVC